jgi:hypothetical protein
MGGDLRATEESAAAASRRNGGGRLEEQWPAEKIVGDGSVKEAANRMARGAAGGGDRSMRR